jgi:hypothetical protein
VLESVLSIIHNVVTICFGHLTLSSGHGKDQFSLGYKNMNFTSEVMQGSVFGEILDL